MTEWRCRTLITIAPICSRSRAVIENGYGYNVIEYQHPVKDKNAWKIASGT